MAQRAASAADMTPRDCTFRERSSASDAGFREIQPHRTACVSAARNTVKVPDGHIRQFICAQTTMPLLHIGNTQPSERHPSDAVFLDARYPRRLIPMRRRCPRRRAASDPRVQHVGHRAPSGTASRSNRQLPSNAQRFLSRPSIRHQQIVKTRSDKTRQGVTGGP